MYKVKLVNSVQKKFQQVFVTWFSIKCKKTVVLEYDIMTSLKGGYQFYCDATTVQEHFEFEHTGSRLGMTS